MSAHIEARMLVPDDVLIQPPMQDGSDGDTGHGLVRIAHGVHAPPGGHGPVVLVHGTPSSSVIWREVAPRLVGAGYVVHVYDLLGYGASERPQPEAVNCSVTGQVDVLLRLMDHWGLRDAHLVAHDIGGAVAQRLGVLHRGRVRSLALLDVCSFDSWPSVRTRQQMREGLDALTLAPPERHRAHFADWLLSTVENKDAMRSGPLDHYLGIITGSVGQASFFQHQVSLYDPHHTDELTPRLAELGEVPVTLVWGERDGWQDPSWARKLHDVIPGSRLVMVPHAGHFVMEDAPGPVTEALLNHLKRAASA